MRKSLLIMFLLFTVGMTANAQKCALIDMEYILKNIPAYQSATNELNQTSKQWQSEVEKLGKEAKEHLLASNEEYRARMEELKELSATIHAPREETRALAAQQEAVREHVRCAVPYDLR